MGRILVRGEQGHDIIRELYPLAGEPVIDKPGKGSFHATDLHQILLARDIKTLIVCGVTLVVCPCMWTDTVPGVPLLVPKQWFDGR
jgi:nicotinamidase-related amidase